MLSYRKGIVVALFFSVFPLLLCASVRDKNQNSLLYTDKHDIRYYGATEGKDCALAIQKALNANKGSYILIPEGRFRVDENVRVAKGSLTIKGLGDASILYTESDIVMIDYSNDATERLTVKDVCFESKKGKGTALKLGNKGLCLNAVIDHCVFRDFHTAISLNKEVDNFTVRDCYFMFNVNGIRCDDVSTNKSGVRVYGNHFQMQRDGGVSVHLEVGSSVDVSNNLFQTSNRNNAIFMKLHSLNQVVVSNNYLEISKSSDPTNNIGIDLDYVNGMKIDHIRAQGYMHSVVRVYNSFWTEIDRVIYSPLGHKISSIIENVPKQKKKKIILDLTSQAISDSNSNQPYIDNMDGVSFAMPTDNLTK